MSPLLAPTTREHYDKYKAMAADWKVTPAMAMYHVGITSPDKLRRLFRADPNLNNIPLGIFDRLPVRPGHSMADNTCVYKHVLIYDCAGVLPLFCNSYDQLMVQEWRLQLRDELPAWLKPDGTRKTDAEHSAWLRMTRDERKAADRKLLIETQRAYKKLHPCNATKGEYCVQCGGCWACRGIKPGVLRGACDTCGK